MSDLSQENTSMAGKILKWLILGPILLVFAIIAVALLYFFYCEANKAYWDSKVKAWCQKDGGVEVYEKVELSKDEYERNGGEKGVIRVLPEKISPDNDEYAYRSFRSEINSSDPQVWRTEYITYRKSDGKSLGRWVTYTRRGGDSFVIDAGTSFSCKDMNVMPIDIEKQIFTVKAE